MPEIEIWVTDRGGGRIAILPTANLQGMSWVLNDEGTASFTIDPLAQGANQIQGIRREIQIWFDNILVWWGVPWGIAGNSKEVTVTCRGLLSYFMKRFIDRMTLTYSSIDQLSIAWDLLNYAQSETVEAYRNLNISSATFALSGVPRSRIYARDEHKFIFDCLKEFDERDLNNGFDWEIAVTGDGHRFWTPYYPIKGSIRNNYTIEWTADKDQRNISDFSWSQDFTSLATLAYVTGGTVSTGSSSFKKEGKYEEVVGSRGSNYWGQMQTIVSDGTQLDQAWLDDRAYQEVLSRMTPTTTFGITSARTVDIDMFQNVFVGDQIHAKIDCGLIQSDPDVWQRIVAMNWNPDNSLGLTFAGPTS